jgi:hypothetical protein
METISGCITTIQDFLYLCLGNGRYPPPHLFEPAEGEKLSRTSEHGISSSVRQDFDKDVQEQMRLLEESVRAMLKPDPSSGNDSYNLGR